MLQNADITLKDVFVPDCDRLANARDFETGTVRVLAPSRHIIGFMACGIAAGAYESALAYCLKRKQFGKPVASFQLIQEKLSRMLTMVEMMLSMLITTSLALQEGKITFGQITRVKAGCTAMSRDVCRLAREVCGGNGILLENHVMKAMMDIESLYTFEGTYEVNTLVSGRELTGGLAAFK